MGWRKRGRRESEGSGRRTRSEVRSFQRLKCVRRRTHGFLVAVRTGGRVGGSERDGCVKRLCSCAVCPMGGDQFLDVTAQYRAAAAGDTKSLGARLQPVSHAGKWKGSRAPRRPRGLHLVSSALRSPWPCMHACGFEGECVSCRRGRRRCRRRRLPGKQRIGGDNLSDARFADLTPIVASYDDE
eukprot:6192895-Pleurochrysis_carterae.AAC.1